MEIYIVIPARNEAENIRLTLNSLTTQSLLPTRIVVVDDHSTDGTAEVAEQFSTEFPWISVVRNLSAGTHLPGSKVINAFYKGFETLDDQYDLICKFDADLVFPENYLEKISEIYSGDLTVGMVGGFCHIKVGNNWKPENLTGRDHIRGALKSYRKECFRDIGGLKPSMGWDTVDELLAQFKGWKVITDNSLAVKHLKPTGFSYHKEAKLKQGQAFFKLRYGFPITLIASVKLALKKGDIQLVKDYLKGFYSAKRAHMPYLVSKKEGAFIRRLRYKKMLSKIF